MLSREGTFSFVLRVLDEKSVQFKFDLLIKVSPVENSLEARTHEASSSGEMSL